MVKKKQTQQEARGDKPRCSEGGDEERTVRVLPITGHGETRNDGGQSKQAPPPPLHEKIGWSMRSTTKHSQRAPTPLITSFRPEKQVPTRDATAQKDADDEGKAAAEIADCEAMPRTLVFTTEIQNTVLRDRYRTLWAGCLRGNGSFFVAVCQIHSVMHPGGGVCSWRRGVSGLGRASRHVWTRHELISPRLPCLR